MKKATYEEFNSEGIITKRKKLNFWYIKDSDAYGKIEGLTICFGEGEGKQICLKKKDILAELNRGK